MGVALVRVQALIDRRLSRYYAIEGDVVVVTLTRVCDGRLPRPLLPLLDMVVQLAVVERALGYGTVERRKFRKMKGGIRRTRAWICRWDLEDQRAVIEVGVVTLYVQHEAARLGPKGTAELTVCQPRARELFFPKANMIAQPPTQFCFVRKGNTCRSS